MIRCHIMITGIDVSEHYKVTHNYLREGREAKKCYKLLVTQRINTRVYH